jgi:hypothetical protein
LGVFRLTPAFSAGIGQDLGDRAGLGGFWHLAGIVTLRLLIVVDCGGEVRTSRSRLSLALGVQTPYACTCHPGLGPAGTLNPPAPAFACGPKYNRRRF